MCMPYRLNEGDPELGVIWCGAKVIVSTGRPTYLLPIVEMHYSRLKCVNYTSEMLFSCIESANALRRCGMKKIWCIIWNRATYSFWSEPRHTVRFFLVFCFLLVLTNFTHILQGYSLALGDRASPEAYRNYTDNSHKASKYRRVQ